MGFLSSAASAPGSVSKIGNAWWAPATLNSFPIWVPWRATTATRTDSPEASRRESATIRPRLTLSRNEQADRSTTIGPEIEYPSASASSCSLVAMSSSPSSADNGGGADEKRNRLDLEVHASSSVPGRMRGVSMGDRLTKDQPELRPGGAGGVFHSVFWPGNPTYLAVTDLTSGVNPAMGAITSAFA